MIKYYTTSYYFILLYVIVFFAACSQPEGPFGSDIGSELGGRTATATFGVERDTSFAAEQVGTGASPHLYAGSSRGIHSQSLMKFYRPILPFEWTIDSAYVRMAYQGGIGEGAEIEIESAVLDYAWSESDPPDYDFILNVSEGTDRLWSQTVNASQVGNDSGFVYFPVSNEWVNEWLNWSYAGVSDTTWGDTTRADSALSLNLFAADAQPDADLLVRFRSRSATADTLRPQLFMFLTAKDSVDGADYADTLKMTASADIFLVWNDSTDTGQDLVIGSGAVFQSNVSFNVTELSDQNDENSYIVVNHAVLTLFKNTQNNTVMPVTRSLWPFKLADDLGFTSPKEAEVTNFVLLPTAIDSTLDSLEVLVTTAVGEWIRKPELNFGLSLHAGTEGLDINRLNFYSSNAIDPSVRPKITVYYTEVFR